ncbi:MAG: hypothetical protein RIR11_4349 [Bacteroidota bacterium]|jgi:uncharacterized protein YecE (DUF72 family)
MEFGKLANVDDVDFSLPIDYTGNAQVLQKQESTTPLIYIGATGYNMKDWVGKWYPVGTKERDYLKVYGRQFNTIEHNTTHYRIPDTTTIQRWCEDTPDDFKFCPKVPQTISHARDLGLSSSDLRFFVEQMRLFGSKMGYCFLQLPPYFEPKHLQVLVRFIEKWPAYIPLAVEVRHEYFFVKDGIGNAFFELLESTNTCSVITDVSGRRDVCHSRLTTNCAMIRFVGNGLHATDYSRVDAWAERIRDWVEQGLKTVYFFTHEPDNLLSPELARYVAERFAEVMPEVKFRAPTEIISPGQQGTLF